MSAPFYGYTLPVYNSNGKKKCSVSCKKDFKIAQRTKFSTSFSPMTRLKLKDGRILSIKDLSLGDVLENGEIVNVIFKIRNVDKVPFYRLFNSQLNEYIYVTGCHHILEYGKFIRVKDSQLAEKTDVIGDMFMCLITSTHRIPIGEHTFWDWLDVCCHHTTHTIPQRFFTLDRYNQI